MMFGNVVYTKGLTETLNDNTTIYCISMVKPEGEKKWMLETSKMYETRAPYIKIKFLKMTNFRSDRLNQTRV
jgi:hypothetical protein